MIWLLVMLKLSNSSTPTNMSFVTAPSIRLFLRLRIRIDGKFLKASFSTLVILLLYSNRYSNLGISANPCLGRMVIWLSLKVMALMVLSLEKASPGTEVRLLKLMARVLSGIPSAKSPGASAGRLQPVSVSVLKALRDEKAPVADESLLCERLRTPRVLANGAKSDAVMPVNLLLCTFSPRSFLMDLNPPKLVKVLYPKLAFSRLSSKPAKASGSMFSIDIRSSHRLLTLRFLKALLGSVRKVVPSLNFSHS